MQLNTLKPAAHSRAQSKRVGRGAGSGLGKTCGRGHKGQHARSGGYHKTGFEGGQMPLQRRLPKVGFRARVTSSRVEVRLSELAAIDAELIDLSVLKKAKIVPICTTRAKVISSGALSKAVTVRGLALTKGASAAIEAAGGRIEE